MFTTVGVKRRNVGVKRIDLFRGFGALLIKIWMYTFLYFSSSLIAAKLADLQMSPTEREQLEEFLKHKKELPVLSSADLEQVDVLGSGNSGVVTKVRHTRTNIVMARKVSLIFGRCL